MVICFVSWRILFLHFYASNISLSFIPLSWKSEVPCHICYTEGSGYRSFLNRGLTFSKCMYL